MKTIGFITKKGGAAKTSTCHHIAHAMRQLGHRVLLCDLDGQASLTQGLLGTEKTLAMHPAETVAGLFNDSGMTMEEIIRPLGDDDFALVAAHDDLYLYNETRPWTRGEQQFILRDALASVADSWDYCLVDGPPHIQLLGWNVLAAADGIVVPAEMEEFGCHGVAGVIASLVQARELANPRLKLIGILPTKFKASLRIHNAFVELIRERFGDDIFRTMVMDSTDFKEAVTANLAVGEYKKRSKAAKIMVELAAELVGRVEERCCEPAAEALAMAGEGE